MCAKICSWKVCAICSGCNALIFLFVGIFAFSALQGVIQQQAIQQVRMGSQTYSLWGEIPGQLGANISRYYTFYNFTNPYETVYLNQTPVFVLMEPNLYQEYQYFLYPNFTDIDSDGELDIVNYYYYDYVLPNNVPPNQNVTTINLGPMGFWYNVKTAPPAQIGVTILAILFQGIETQILNTVFATGIYYNFFSQSYNTYASIIGKIITDPVVLDNVWYDPVYGMGNPNTLAAWIQATIDGVDSGASFILMDYFGISYGQMYQIVSDKPEAESYLSTAISGIKDNIAGMFMCPMNPCSAAYLAALQWSTQNVTMNVQPPIPAQISITTANTTAVGFPEISYFLSNYLIPKQNLPVEFNITWTPELGLQLFNYAPSPNSNYCKNADTLLNIGNLEFLFSVGEAFDTNPDLQNLTALTPIQQRFNLPSLQHAYVLYQYVQYMYAEFGEQQSLGGDASILMLGNSFSQVLYQYFAEMQGYLLPEITSQLMFSNISSQNYDCESLFDETFGDPNMTNAACSLSYLNPFTIDSTRYMYYACLSQATPNFKELDPILNLTTNLSNYINLCQDPQNGFSAFFVNAQLAIQTHYNCSKITGACGFYEVAVKQWTSSSITSNPPLGVPYPASNSVNSWNSTLFPEVFEYYAVLNDMLPGAFPGYPQPLPPIPEEVGYNLTNFNSLFNGVVAGNVFIYSMNNMTQYNQAFGGIDAFLLKTYMRYIFLDVFMGGFAQTRPAVDLLWGYEDPLLAIISQLDPLQGGDPAVNPIIAISGGNMSYEQAFDSPYSMYTGYGDVDKLRFYISCYGKTFIAANTSTFNGNETVVEYTNPWRYEVPIYGTDSILNKPGLDESYEPPIFINSIYFQSNGTYQNQNPDYYGLEALRFGIGAYAMANSTINPNNYAFYSDKWNGLLNFSSVQQAPVFFSKNNFLECDQPIIDAVKLYYDDALTEPIVPGPQDDTFVDLEPTTGATLGSMVRLQLNYELQNDSLFNAPTYAMLPIFNLQRGSNFTESQISTTYGQLIVGLTLVDVGPMISFILFGILLVLTGFSVYKVRMQNKMTRNRVRHQEIESSILVVDNNVENTQNLMVLGAEEQRLGENLLQDIQNAVTPQTTETGDREG